MGEFHLTSRNYRMKDNCGFSAYHYILLTLTQNFGVNTIVLIKASEFLRIDF